MLNKVIEKRLELMNGILLFGIPEIVIQIVFGIIAIINIFLVVKRVYPEYKKSFSK